MARGFNKVLIMGNLARDPEIRYTASKQAVAKLTVAVGHQYKGKNGEVVDQTDFIPVVVWGSQAENCERYLRKGGSLPLQQRREVPTLPAFWNRYPGHGQDGPGNIDQ